MQLFEESGHRDENYLVVKLDEKLETTSIQVDKVLLLMEIR